MEQIYIPENQVITEHGYFTLFKIGTLLKKYKNNPKAVDFIAEMIQ